MLPTAVLPARDSDGDERQLLVSSTQHQCQLPSLALGCVHVTPFTCAPMCDVYVSGVRKLRDVAATPVNLTDRYALASCTKAMTATLLAILIEQQLLTWDTTLTEALHSLAAVMHPSYRAVTLSMLTSHMAGLPREAPSGQEEREEMAAATLTTARRLATARLLSSPPAHTPGTRHAYSNAGYIVLGAAMEECTGRSWEELMMCELFTPLGINNFGFGCPVVDFFSQHLDTAEQPTQPWPHYRRAGGGVTQTIDPATADVSAMPLWRGPCGTVNCSLNEWAKFAALHIDGFLGRPTPILTADSFAMLHREAGQHCDYTYGGWHRKRHALGYDTLTHNGNNNRGVATIWIAPTKHTAYMAVSNIGTGGGGTKALNHTISEMIKLDQRRERQRTAAALRLPDSPTDNAGIGVASF